METSRLTSITTTAETVDQLAPIAKALIAERLAACVNIVPGVRSLYLWDGEVQDDGEVLAFIHTQQSLVPRVIERITELHPYDTPQVLALTILGAQPEYAAWLVDATS